MNVYLFDVDHTLTVSHGPIAFGELAKLHREGHVVGLCGNWSHALRMILPENWRGLLSFIGPMMMTKHDFMIQIRSYFSANDYILVGNDPADFPGQQVSQDKQEAALAGWRFIREIDFQNGAR